MVLWINKVVFLWNRTLVALVDKLSSTTVDFIRSEGELKNCALYWFQEVLYFTNVHGIDKGIDPNVRLEKQVIRKVVTPQTHILPEIKNISHVKWRIGQSRVGIKKKMLRFPVSQLYD